MPGLGGFQRLDAWPGALSALGCLAWGAFSAAISGIRRSCLTRVQRAMVRYQINFYGTLGCLLKKLKGLLRPLLLQITGCAIYNQIFPFVEMLTG
jgi:hypothetical protein